MLYGKCETAAYFVAVLVVENPELRWPTIMFEMAESLERMSMFQWTM